MHRKRILDIIGGQNQIRDIKRDITQDLILLCYHVCRAGCPGLGVIQILPLDVT